MFCNELGGIRNVVLSKLSESFVLIIGIYIMDQTDNRS